jgi:hypothetical protein
MCSVIRNVLTVSIFAVFSAQGLASTKTLTIKGSNADSGDTIEIPVAAEVSLRVHSEGIEITMPDLDVRLRCLGEATANGYCYISADSSAIGGDADNDGVPDEWDQCPGTSASFTNSVGCADADADGDGVVGAADQCPNSVGPASNNGCPVEGQTYTVTASVTGGNGSISPSGAQTVASGEQPQFTLVPAAGYDVGGVAGTCSGSLSGTTYTVSSVSASCTVIATFDAQPDSGGNPSYCQNPGSNVDCSASVNMAPWGNAPGYNYYEYPVRAGRVRSFPFTYKAAGTRDQGSVDITSNMGSLLNHSFVAWISDLPNGAPISSGCSKGGSEAVFKLNWGPGADGFNKCGLGDSERVYHLNFAVQGDTVYTQDFYFELANF